MGKIIKLPRCKWCDTTGAWRCKICGEWTCSDCYKGSGYDLDGADMCSHVEYEGVTGDGWGD